MQHFYFFYLSNQFIGFFLNLYMLKIFSVSQEIKLSLIIIGKRWERYALYYSIHNLRKPLIVLAKWFSFEQRATNTGVQYLTTAGHGNAVLLFN